MTIAELHVQGSSFSASSREWIGSSNDPNANKRNLPWCADWCLYVSKALGSYTASAASKIPRRQKTHNDSVTNGEELKPATKESQIWQAHCNRNSPARWAVNKEL
jgi:hypothetical protein